MRPPEPGRTRPRGAGRAPGGARRGPRAACLAGCLAVGAAVGGLSGCSLLSPMPLWELTKGGGLLARQALERSPAEAVDVVVHEGLRGRALCIELNPTCPVGDIVPALQAELGSRGVSSRVFESAAPGAPCEAWLHYEASIAWEVPAFEALARPYLAQATLGLRDGQGRVLGAARYESDPGSARGRWAGTRAKLAPVISVLLAARG